MAIKVIPQEDTFRESRWLSVLFVISIIFFVLSLFSYFLIATLTSRAEEKVKGLEATLSARTKEEKALEEKVLTYQQKIKDFTPLLENHRKITELFTLLERTTHPQVRFTELKFDSLGATLNLQGQTENFQTLSQQEILFEKTPAFKEVNLGNAALTEGGKVRFDLLLVLNPGF